VFHLLKDTFDAVPISMPLTSTIEVVFAAGAVKRNRTIYKSNRVIDLVFFLLHSTKN